MKKIWIRRTVCGLLSAAILIGTQPIVGNKGSYTADAESRNSFSTVDISTASDADAAEESYTTSEGGVLAEQSWHRIFF